MARRRSAAVIDVVEPLPAATLAGAPSAASGAGAPSCEPDRKATVPAAVVTDRGVVGSLVALVPELVRDRRELLLLKKTYSAFSNPNLEPLLAALDPDEVLVFGVATDVCNHAAIMGLLARGRRVAFVEDASRGLDERRVAAALEQWRAGGVRFTTSDEVVG